jgi:hypothetical protein
MKRFLFFFILIIWEYTCEETETEESQGMPRVCSNQFNDPTCYNNKT